MMVSSLLTGTGLIFDIFGAIILAAPDVSLLAKRFEFGRLRHARKQMEAEGVQARDAGFDSLLNIVETVGSVEQASGNDVGDEIVEIIIDRRTGLAPSDIDFSWGEEYVEARYEPDADWDEADILDTGMVYRRIRTKVDTKATQVRATGLVMLAGGFSLQLVATFV